MKLKSLVFALLFVLTLGTAYAVVPPGLAGQALGAAVANEVAAQRAANPNLTDDQLAALVMGQMQAAGYPLGLAVAVAQSAGINSTSVVNAAAASYGVTPAAAAAAGTVASNDPANAAVFTAAAPAAPTGAPTTAGAGTGTGTGAGGGGGGGASGG